MFVCTFFAIELALTYARWREAARLWLLAWAMTAALLYVGHFVFFHHLLDLMPVMDSLYTTCNLAVYPLYLIYIYRMTERTQPRWLTWLLLLPAGMGLVAGGLYLAMDADEVRRFFGLYLYENTLAGLSGVPLAMGIHHHVCRVFFAVEVVMTVVLGIRQIRRYNHLVETLYADTEDKTLEAIHRVLVLLVVTAAVSFVANVLGRAVVDDFGWLKAMMAVLFSSLLFSIGWVGLWQRFSITDVVRDIETHEAELLKDGGVVAFDFLGSKTPLKQKLEWAMREQQLYLQADLKLSDVARQLGTNRTYLQQMLRDELHVTFSEYVNRLRINHARRLLQQEPEQPLSNVAHRVGYASLSSFYRNWNRYSMERVEEGVTAPPDTR